jgi:exodeoxyribonuclease-3
MRLRVTTLNCNGLRSASRRGFRDWLGGAAPDVLLLQEVRADADSLPADLLTPEGWTCAWHFAAKKGYAGTAVWVRDPGAGGNPPFQGGRTPPVTVSFTRGCGHARGEEEGRVVGAHLRWTDGRALDCWSMYLPSGSSGPERQDWKFSYMEHAQAWFAARLASGVPTIVGGDLNIAHTPMDIRNARSNEKNSGFLPEERAWLGARLAEGWQDSFRVANPERVAYSWWSNRGNARANDVGWRIDYLLATPQVRVLASDIERGANLSDHAPVTVDVEV